MSARNEKQLVKECNSISDNINDMLIELQDSAFDLGVKRGQEAAEAVVKELRESLVALHAVQNGPPLIRDADKWQTAMDMVEKVLSKKSSAVVPERHAKCDRCGWTGPESGLFDDGKFIFCPQCRNCDGNTLRPVEVSPPAAVALMNDTLEGHE